MAMQSASRRTYLKVEQACIQTEFAKYFDFMDNVVKILSTEYLTHNVIQLRVTKPAGFTYDPGQATDVSINEPGWRDKKNPFTFTSLNDALYLEFIIKIYPESKEGVTKKLSTLLVGDELILGEAWGAISYEGPGYFIAGGAGITPFIAILRELKKRNKLTGNKLFFSNRTEGDIILADELKGMLGRDALFLVNGQEAYHYDNRFIDEAFLKDKVTSFNRLFYICGPDLMTDQISKTLTKLGVAPEMLIFER